MAAVNVKGSYWVGGITAIHPPLVFFIFIVLQKCGNPSKLRGFGRKVTCTLCVKNGCSVYSLNVKGKGVSFTCNIQKKCLSPELMIGVLTIPNCILHVLQIV